MQELRCGEFWFGEMWCRGAAVWRVALWKSCIVGVFQCGGFAVWGSCRVGELQYGVVALWRSFGVGSFGVGSFGVGSFDVGRCGVGELHCRGIAL